MKKTLSIIWKTVTTVITVLMILLAVALVGVRLIGFTPYAILTGSMTPTYQVGDLIYTKKADFSNIQSGDVITFVADKNLTLVTHRVVAVDESSRTFQTQGDANDTPDAKPVMYENVVGTVHFSLPKLGYLSNFVASRSGKFICAAAVAALIILLIVPELFKKDSDKNKKTKNGEQNSQPSPDAPQDQPQKINPYSDN